MGGDNAAGGHGTGESEQSHQETGALAPPRQPWPFPLRIRQVPFSSDPGAREPWLQPRLRHFWRNNAADDRADPCQARAMEDACYSQKTGIVNIPILQLGKLSQSLNNLRAALGGAVLQAQLGPAASRLTPLLEREFKGRTETVSFSGSFIRLITFPPTLHFVLNHLIAA